MADKDYLEMSDDDFLKEPAPEVTDANISTPEPKVDPEPSTEGQDDPANAGGEDDNQDPPNPEGDKPEGEEDPAAAPSGSEESGEAGATKPEGDQKPEGEEDPKEKKDPPEPKETAKAVDYEAGYKSLIGTPIKANGKEIIIDSVDDARRLIQMGANYNHQMKELKPIRKRMKALEQAGITSDDQVDFLIDLHLQKKEAISKLIADSKIDPLDLNADNASNYKPTAHRISDQQFDLDSTLDDLQSSPVYPQTLELVTRKWDAASQQEIAKQPQLFRYMHDHMENGIAPLVLQEIERQEMLGSLSGLTSLQKYDKVGNELNGKGAFNHLFEKKTVSNAPAPGTVITPAEKEPKKDDKLNSQRRAAAPSRSAPGKTKSTANPLEMSDDEFEKLSESHFR